MKYILEDEYRKSLMDSMVYIKNECSKYPYPDGLNNVLYDLAEAIWCLLKQSE